MALTAIPLFPSVSVAQMTRQEQVTDATIPLPESRQPNQQLIRTIIDASKAFRAVAVSPDGQLLPLLVLAVLTRISQRLSCGTLIPGNSYAPSTSAPKRLPLAKMGKPSSVVARVGLLFGTCLL